MAYKCTTINTLSTLDSAQIHRFRPKAEAATLVRAAQVSGWPG